LRGRLHLQKLFAESGLLQINGISQAPEVAADAALRREAKRRAQSERNA
jgi:hypothetical protein